MDDITVESELKDSNFTRTQYVPTWFAKTRELLRLEKNDLKFAAHRSDDNREYGIDESDRKYCFVQYFDFLPNIPIDRIGSAPSRVRPQWDGRKEVVRNLSALKCFRLLRRELFKGTYISSHRTPPISSWSRVFRMKRKSARSVMEIQGRIKERIMSIAFKESSTSYTTPLPKPFHRLYVFIHLAV